MRNLARGAVRRNFCLNGSRRGLGNKNGVGLGGSGEWERGAFWEWSFFFVFFSGFRTGICGLALIWEFFVFMGWKVSYIGRVM